MASPYEVIAAPLTVYVAPVTTAKPALNASPSGSWVKLGTSGNKNYSNKGVVVTHDQTIVTWTPAGSTGARKAWRTAETVTVEFDLVDLTAEQYAQILNGASVTTDAGPPARKYFNLEQGAVVTELALLARGLSPISESLPAQYFIPIVFQTDNPAPAFASAGNPAMLSCKFQALEDATQGFGIFEEQTA